MSLPRSRPPTAVKGAKDNDSLSHRLNAMFFLSADNFGGPPLTISSHHEAEEVTEQQHPYPEDFQAMFTLIQDEAGEYYHPHVHYIFSDDNHDIVTGAVVGALSTQSADVLLDNTHKEHYIILDLNTTGSHVVAAQSLSSDWQVSSTELSEAPSFADKAASTMLKIRGISAPASTTKDSHDPAVEARKDDAVSHYDAMTNLAAKFQKDLEKTQKMMSQWDEA